MGLLSSQFARSLLSRFPTVFTAESSGLTFTEDLNSPDKRSLALADVLLELREEDSQPPLRGWRDESYEIRQSFSQPTLFSLERAASPLFGVRKYGVQINGEVHHSRLGLCLWLQRRFSIRLLEPTNELNISS